MDRQHPYGVPNPDLSGRIVELCRRRGWQPLALVFLACWCVAVLAAEPVILVLGDSLSAGFGIDDVAKGWVARLQARLKAQGYPHRVVNASISGDTTRGARSRLPAALDTQRAVIVIVELGGNDGLRGLKLSQMHANLVAIVSQIRAVGAKALLVGVRLPPNYGPAYTERFHAVYPKVAEAEGIAWVPNLLKGVDDRPELMQADGIHPRAEAQTLILDTVWVHLQPLL